MLFSSPPPVTTQHRFIPHLLRQIQETEAGRKRAHQVPRRYRHGTDRERLTGSKCSNIVLYFSEAIVYYYS